MSFPEASADEQHRDALRPLTIVVAAMGGGLVMLAVVLVLIGARLETPALWQLLVVGLATVGAWVLAVAAPIPRQSGMPLLAQVQPFVVLRAAVIEAPAMVGLVLAFVNQPMNLLVYLLPAVFSLAGLWLFARPSVVVRRLSRAS
ncbi:hypothetical protein [uncultured Serinicoccus sp.]|uniref:hypothetical protein n=1 Tax=uncultured Serinicoccus sp. TaxID=735514 RepID=UPI002620513C|nr:hypothetical protein [uncultured Serinicoccus sp.]